MSKKALFVLVATAVAGVSTGVAWSSIPNSSTQVITGCYSKTTGTLRVIDKQAGKKCKSTERELAWNQAGAPGIQGPAGPKGAQGPQGPAGSGGGASSALHVQDANGVDLGSLVLAPADDSAPIPGDPLEFVASRAVVVLRPNGTFMAYDVGTGAVARHGDLYYFTADCSGTAYIRLSDLTTLTTFYGIAPLEVNDAGGAVRGLGVTGAAVVPTDIHALLSAKSLGDAGCLDYSGFPLYGPEYTVKAAATVTPTPADVPGPLHLVASS